MGPGAAVVNVDDEYGRRLAEEFDCVTFSAEGANAEIVARDVCFDVAGAKFTAILGSGGSTGLKAANMLALSPVGSGVEVRTGLPGHFNVSNALGAFTAAIALDVAPEAAAAGLARAQRVPGRFEPIEEGQDFAVLVDYAHTPDSLENVLGAARELTAGLLIAVFGAGGDRDRGKRPKMGRAGAALSDLAIITSDNPRSEDPGAIIAEVLGGVGNGAKVEVEPDRRAAIALAVTKAALGRAQPGDTVVIAGKGHEQGQEFADGRKLPFDDREVARAELRRL